MKRPTLTIISPGAWNFASYLYPILDCEYSPNNLPVSTDIGFMFGVFMGQWDFFTPTRDCKRKIVTWIGTDVLQLKEMMVNHPEVVPVLNTYMDVRLADADCLAEELTELGVKIDGVVETPPRHIFEPMKLPKDFTVGLYQPGTRPDFYHYDLSLEVAKKMPDTQFLCYGLYRDFNENDPSKNQIADNVWDLGHINVAHNIKSMSAILRFTPHDGMAIGPIEFMMAGRRAVTNQPIPKTTHSPIDVDKAVAALTKIKTKTTPDKKASAYWRNRLNHPKWKKQMEKYIYG